jgi:hypothetical protein
MGVMQTLTLEMPGQRAPGFLVTGAAIIGRGHAALRKNKQDAVAYGCGSWGVCGVVADGCGSGDASELGAILSARAMEVAVARAMTQGASPREALLLGTTSVRDALASVALRCSDASTRAAFVAQHLLATVLAFVVTRDVGAILAAGDGIARADEEWFVFDEDNAPRYIGYRIIERQRVEPHVIELARPSLVAIGTDGFDRPSLDGASALVRRDAARGEPRLARDLVRHMRTRQREGAFEDDGAIVVAHRLEGACT